MDYYIKYTDEFYKHITDILKNIDNCTILDNFSLEIYNYYRLASSSFKEYKKNAYIFNTEDKKLQDIHKNNLLKYRFDLGKKKKIITKQTISNIAKLKEDLEKNIDIIEESIKMTRSQQLNNINTFNSKLENEQSRKNNINTRSKNEIIKIKNKYNLLSSELLATYENEKANIKSTYNRQDYRYIKANKSILLNYSSNIEKHKRNLTNYYKDLDLIYDQFSQELLEYQKISNSSIFEINKEKIEKHKKIESKYNFEINKNHDLISNIEKKYVSLKSNYTRNFVTEIENINDKIKLLDDQKNNKLIDIKKEYEFKKISHITSTSDNLEEYRNILKIIQNLDNDLEDRLDLININYNKEINILLENKKQLERKRLFKFEEFDSLQNLEIIELKRIIDITKLNMNYEINKNEVSAQIKINPILTDLEKKKLDLKLAQSLQQNNINKEINIINLSIDELNEEINYANLLEKNTNDISSFLLLEETKLLDIKNTLNLEINNYKTLSEITTNKLRQNLNDLNFQYNLKKQKINLEKRNKLLENSILTLEENVFKIKKNISYDIELSQLEEKKEINILQNNNSNLIFNSLTLYLSKRFILLKTHLESLFTSIRILYKKLTLLYKNIVTTDISQEIIIKIQDEIIIYFENIFSLTFEELKKHILKHIKHQTNDKFNPMFIQLKQNHDVLIDKYNTKIKTINETINNYKDTIKQFSSQIILLEKTSNKEDEIKVYMNKIYNNEKSIHKFTNEINQTYKLINNENKNYNISIKKITTKQNKEAILLFDYIEKIDIIYNNVNHHIFNIKSLDNYQTNKVILLEKYLNFGTMSYLNNLGFKLNLFYKKSTKNQKEKNNKLLKTISDNHIKSLNLLEFDKKLFNNQFNLKLNEIKLLSKNVESNISKSLKTEDEDYKTNSKSYIKESNSTNNEYKKRIEAAESMIFDMTNENKSLIKNTKENYSLQNKKLLTKFRENRNNIKFENEFKLKKNTKDLLFQEKNNSLEFDYLDTSLPKQNKELLKTISLTIYKDNLEKIENKYKLEIKLLKEKHTKRFKTKASYQN